MTGEMKEFWEAKAEKRDEVASRLKLLWMLGSPAEALMLDWTIVSLTRSSTLDKAVTGAPNVESTDVETIVVETG